MDAATIAAQLEELERMPLEQRVARLEELERTLRAALDEPTE